MKGLTEYLSEFRTLRIFIQSWFADIHLSYDLFDEQLGGLLLFSLDCRRFSLHVANIAHSLDFVPPLWSLSSGLTVFGWYSLPILVALHHRFSWSRIELLRAVFSFHLFVTVSALGSSEYLLTGITDSIYSHFTPN